MTLNARSMFAVFAASGSKKRGGGSWSIKDFLPQSIIAKWRKQQRAKSPEELLAQAKHITAMIAAAEQSKQRKKEKGSGIAR